jgi:hypothetical protein
MESLIYSPGFLWVVYMGTRAYTIYRWQFSGKQIQFFSAISAPEITGYKTGYKKDKYLIQI